MQNNTPPLSPQLAEEEDEVDLGEIEEVIDFDQLNDEMSDGGSGAEDMEEAEAGEVTEMATLVFAKHSGSVFCCSISPAGNVAATGGEDDKAYVWEVATGTVLLTCTGHKDSVTEVSFSHDGSLLATADYGGYIQVWRMSSLAKIWEFEVGDIGWLCWHPGAHVLLTGTTNGEMWLWLIPQGNTRTFPSYGAPSTCGAFLHDGKRAVSGYGDGSVRVFDLKTGQLMHQLGGEGGVHEGPVVSVTTHHDNTLVATGSCDNTAKLHNATQGKVLGTLNCQVSAGGEEEGAAPEVDHTVEAVSFCPQLPNLLVTATLAGVLTVWDFTSQVSRHVMVQGCGTSELTWHPTEAVVLAAGLDGDVHSYDVRSGEAVARYTGHKKSVLALSLSKDGRTLVTAGDDGEARVFKLS